jgi:ABC-2 type transport system permease protein
MTLAAWQVLYEQRAFWRNRTRAFFSVVFPLTLMVLFSALNPSGGFVPGLLAYSVVMATFTNLAVETARMRDAGVLKRMQGTPLPGGVFLAGRIGSTIVVAAAVSVVSLTVGALAFGVDVPAATLPGLGLALAAGTACFTALGIGIARIIPNADAAPAVVNGLFVPLTFISGVWGPTDGEPGWLLHVAQLFPVEHLAHWLRLCLDPATPGPGIDRGDLFALAIWALAGVRLTQRFLRATMQA